MKMKRENNEEEENSPTHGGDKRSRRNDDQVRILIPSNIAGAIIGKGGQHIQKMRTQYKATVSVDDSQGPERTILISSDLESTLQIITEMLKYFEERDEEVDVRLLIHQSLAGCVIGKGGTKIKEIRDKIGCRILKVFSNVAPQSTDRVVQTVGKQSQVIDAIREVITLTREVSDTPIKGPVHNYDPINFDRVYAEEYGGYGSGGSNSRQSRGGNRGNNGGAGGGGVGFGGTGGGGGGGGTRSDRSRSGGRRENPFINPWANDDGFGGNNGSGFGGGNFGGGGFGGGGFGGGGAQGGMGNFGGNAGGFPGSQMGGGPNGNTGFGANNAGTGFGAGMNTTSFSGPNAAGTGATGGFGNGGPNATNGPAANAGGNLPNGHDPKNSQQVTIPKDLAGAIIGKGGGRIRRIRNESGAYITIDEPLPGSDDRIITISGNPKQIQMAQYLLQQSVHENNGSVGGGARRNY